jgi:hypothetical protein
MGTATTQTDNNFTVPIFNALRSSDPFINPTVVAKATVTLTGVSATGELSNLNVWGLIDESQTPNWTDVAA